MKYLQVQWSAASLQEANSVVEQALAKRLIACAHIYPQVNSLFLWEGRVEKAQEVIVTMKSSSLHIERLKKVIQAGASYEVGEIIATELIYIEKAYLAWLNKSLV